MKIKLWYIALAAAGIYLALKLLRPKEIIFQPVNVGAKPAEQSEELTVVSEDPIAFGPLPVLPITETPPVAPDWIEFGVLAPNAEGIIFYQSSDVTRTDIIIRGYVNGQQQSERLAATLGPNQKWAYGAAEQSILIESWRRNYPYAEITSTSWMQKNFYYKEYR